MNSGANFLACNVTELFSRDLLAATNKKECHSALLRAPPSGINVDVRHEVSPLLRMNGKTTATSTDLGEIIDQHLRNSPLEPANNQHLSPERRESIDLQKIIEEDSMADCSNLNEKVSHILRGRKSDLPDSMSKKRRHRLSTEQMQLLESEFQKCHTWNKSQLTQISQRLGLSVSKIYKWNWDRKKKFSNQNNPNAQQIQTEIDSYSSDSY